MEVEVGKRYRHYKDKEYTIIAIGRHEDSPEKLSVIYRAEYFAPDFGEGVIWIRAMDSFISMVTLSDGRVVQRFAPIE